MYKLKLILLLLIININIFASNKIELNNSDKDTIYKIISPDLVSRNIKIEKDSITSYSYIKSTQTLNIFLNSNKNRTKITFTPNQRYLSFFENSITIENNHEGLGFLTLTNGSLSAINNAISSFLILNPQSIGVIGLPLITAGISYFANYQIYKSLDLTFGRSIEMLNMGSMFLINSLTFNYVIDDNPSNKIIGYTNLIAHPLGTYFGYKMNLNNKLTAGNAQLKMALNHYGYITGIFFNLYSKVNNLNNNATLLVPITLSLAPNFFTKHINKSKLTPAAGTNILTAMYSGLADGYTIAKYFNANSDITLLSAGIGGFLNGYVTYNLLNNHQYTVSDYLINRGANVLGGVTALGVATVLGNDDMFWYSLGSIITNYVVVSKLRKPLDNSISKIENNKAPFLTINFSGLMPLLLNKKSTMTNFKTDIIQCNF